MSLETRVKVRNSLVYQNRAAQFSQFTDVEGGRYILDTNLIAAIEYMIDSGMLFVVTALRDDHRWDGMLGPDCHNPCGRAMDFWFLKSGVPTDYLDSSTEQFVRWVGDLKSVPRISGVGLGGSANIAPNREALGSLYCPDNGTDHIHIQVS